MGAVSGSSGLRHGDVWKFSADGRSKVWMPPWRESLRGCGWRVSKVWRKSEGDDQDPNRGPVEEVVSREACHWGRLSWRT